MFLHTTDGGATWTDKIIGSVYLYDVFFIDDQVGWAVGYDGTIRHTHDAGAHWGSQTSGTTSPLYDVHFVDENSYRWEVIFKDFRTPNEEPFKMLEILYSRR